MPLRSDPFTTRTIRSAEQSNLKTHSLKVWVVFQMRDYEDDSPVEDPCSKTPRPFLERVRMHYKFVRCCAFYNYVFVFFQHYESTPSDQWTERTTRSTTSSRDQYRKRSKTSSQSSIEYPAFQPFFSADFAAITGSVRILMTAALEFGNNAFPEFSGLADSEKVLMSIVD